MSTRRDFLGMLAAALVAYRADGHLEEERELPETPVQFPYLYSNVTWVKEPHEVLLDGRVPPDQDFILRYMRMAFADDALVSTITEFLDKYSISFWLDRKEYLRLPAHQAVTAVTAWGTKRNIEPAIIIPAGTDVRFDCHSDSGMTGDIQLSVILEGLASYPPRYRRAA